MIDLAMQKCVKLLGTFEWSDYSSCVKTRCFHKVANFHRYLVKFLQEIILYTEHIFAKPVQNKFKISFTH